MLSEKIRVSRAQLNQMCFMYKESKDGDKSNYLWPETSVSNLVFDGSFELMIQSFLFKFI